jgi:glycosyltransferase involved in cell wall biosynthesis
VVPDTGQHAGLVRVDFAYANPRADLASAIAGGLAPDTGLLGQNHLAGHGVDARIQDSRLRRQTRLPGVAHRVTWLARELAVPFESSAADVIVTPLGTVLPLASRLRRGPKTVVLNINLCTALRRLSGLRRKLLAASLRSADAIVCLADAQRKLLLEQVRLDPAKVHLALLGVDDTFHSPVPRGGESPHVLAVGRDLGRDYATLAQALRSLDVEATIVASERNVRGIEFPPNAKVELDVSPVRLRELYGRATCVVVPTRAQEFDRGADCSGQTVLLDAMAMGRATVISHRSTLDDYIDDGKTALVVTPESPAELEAGIRRVLEDDDVRTTLEREGRARIEREHTTRLFAERLLPILKAVACAR